MYTKIDSDVEQIFLILKQDIRHMTIKVSQKTKAGDLERALKSLKRGKKKINVDKYFGKINFGTDGLTYQKKIRNEWK